jgi:hypothetical protein
MDDGGRVLVQGIEPCLVHRLPDRERPADIHAEQADVDARPLFTDDHHGFRVEFN